MSGIAIAIGYAAYCVTIIAAAYAAAWWSCRR